MPYYSIEGTNSPSFRIGSKGGNFITIVPTETGYIVYDKYGNAITTDINVIIETLNLLAQKIENKLDKTYVLWESDVGYIDTFSFPIVDKDVDLRVYGSSTGMDRLDFTIVNNVTGKNKSDSILFETPLYETDYINLSTGVIHFNNSPDSSIPIKYNEYTKTGMIVNAVSYSLINDTYNICPKPKVQGYYYHSLHDLYENAVFSVNGIKADKNGNIIIEKVNESDKLSHSVNLSLSGAVTGSVSFDLSETELNIQNSVDKSDYGFI